MGERPFSPLPEPVESAGLRKILLVRRHRPKWKWTAGSEAIESVAVRLMLPLVCCFVAADERQSVVSWLFVKWPFVPEYAWI